MIAWLQGILIHKQVNLLIVNVSGVGYEVAVPLSALDELHLNQKVSLFIHHTQREDGQFLYGFLYEDQRKLFRELIRISGVGPKLALQVLSGYSVAQFVEIVREENVSALLKLSGVGKKTAERLLVELKDRLALSFSGASLGLQEYRSSLNTASEEAIEALVALELKPQEARKWVEQAVKASPDLKDVSALIKQALHLKLREGK